MAAKSFDYKQFLLQKGERVGLIGALTLMLVLLIGGSLSGFSVDGPDKTEAALKAGADTIRAKLAGSSGEPSPVAVPSDPVDGGKVEIPASPYRFPQDPIIPWSLETKGRQNPRILEVETGTATFWKGGVWVPDVKAGREEMYRVLVPKEKPKNPVAAAVNAQQQQYLEFLRRQGFQPPMGPAGRPGGPNFGGGGEAAGLAGSGTAKEEYKAEWVRLEALQPTAHLAKTVTPVRMAVVSAAFPYRKQLEEYGQALLRGSSLNNFAANADLVPHFQWFNIRRRTLDASGKTVKDWEPLDMNAEFGWVYKHTLLLADRKDREDPAIEAVKFPGLVYPRLPLADPGRDKDQFVADYPPVRLREIDNSIRMLNEKARGNPNELRLLTPAQRQLADPNANAFDTPVAAEGAPVRPAPIRPFRPGERPMGPAPAPGTNPAPEKQELVAPDYCLVRFTDITVKPGFVYEYQVQIRTKNPNFGKPDLVAYEALAQKADLEGAWGPATPIKVTVPEENFTYASDIAPKENKDFVYVQIHRWMESVKLLNNDVPVPLGNWLIADVPVRRGEFVGKIEPVEVPMWFSIREMFDLPTLSKTPATRKEKGIPVDLATREVLVDYDGGKTTLTARKGGASTIAEEGGYELLVVSPEGKLRVMNSKTDAANNERSARQKEWQATVEVVRKGVNGKPTTTDPFNR